MGMFDWYKPRQNLECPICRFVLDEWQGKDGPNGLFVWREGEISPVDQPIDEECKISQGERRDFRLPEEFVIYSYDCEQHRVLARCRTEDDVWTETLIVAVENVGKLS
jgi:hypothetical protein